MYNKCSISNLFNKKFMIKLKNLISESHHMDTSYTIGPSNINGKGVIAIKMIPANCKGLAHVHCNDFDTYSFTDLGYFINHSETPNCTMIENGNRRYVQSLNDIQPNEELTCNYWKLPIDMETPDEFEDFEYDSNGLRKSLYWNTKIITNVLEPYIKYVSTRR